MKKHEIHAAIQSDFLKNVSNVFLQVQQTV